MQLLPNHDLKKHPYTNKYYQITTSENTHIHTTTPRSQPQKTPIYKQILPYHNLKKRPYTHYYSQNTTSKTPIYIQLPQITTSKDTPLKSINIKKWG